MEARFSMKRPAMIARRKIVFLISLLISLLPVSIPALAALDSVSGLPAPAIDAVQAGGDPARVAISLANGFPLWYRDTSGLKLELCLEQQVEKTAASGGGFFFPCLTAEPFITNPISFPSNFGAEAFYWSATAVTSFTSSTGGGDALLVLAQEAGFFNELPTAGNQIVFGRTRLRVNVPVAGTYRVIHPFGTRDYVVDAVSDDREINQTQDIGILAPLDFPASLGNGPVPPAPAPPSEDVGAVNADGRSIGPFLEGNPIARVFDTAGNRYLADSGTELAPIERPIQAGPEIPVDGVPANVNYFEVTLLDPPGGFLLDAAGIDGTPDNTIRLSQFQIMGKVFNDGANTPPVANPDSAATTRGVPIVVDVAANDTDVVAIDLNDPFNPANPANTNVHGIHPHALAIVNGGRFLINTPLVTANGATVQRTTDLATGKASFLYTPLDSFLAVGDDAFTYVIQDRGGLISAPATVTVTVEDLAANRAEYRPRTGKWHIGGTSSDVTANSVTIHVGPPAGGGPVIGTAIVNADGTWEFQGKSTASPRAAGSVSATSANGISIEAPLRLR